MESKPDAISHPDDSLLRAAEVGTMSCFLLVVGVIVGAAYIFRQVVVKGKKCTSNAKLHGKTVIVTGECSFCL